MWESQTENDAPESERDAPILHFPMRYLFLNSYHGKGSPGIAGRAFHHLLSNSNNQESIMLFSVGTRPEKHLKIPHLGAETGNMFQIQTK